MVARVAGRVVAWLVALMTTPAVTPATLTEAVRIAVTHLRAVQRLRGRYGSEEHRQQQAEAALAVLERALRAEDDTREVLP